MNNKKILELIAKKEVRKSELKAKANTIGDSDVNEIRSIYNQMDLLDDEIKDIRGMIDDTQNAPSAYPPVNEQRVAGSTIGATQILGTYGVGAGGAPAGEQRNEVADQSGTMEYRKAFMEFCKSGTMTPELRANAMTSVADASAVIPTTILNEIIRKVSSYGQVFSRIRPMAVKGGVNTPILSLKPVASWIGESAVSDKQKVQANTNVSFSYFGLECKVSTTLLADTVTLAGFENIIIDLIVEAMLISIETAIIKGTGIGQPLGITADPRVPESQIVTLSAADFIDWSGWQKKVVAKIPLSYKAGASFFMASGTFEGYINGMVDANGQPIGRMNYGITDGSQERFGGRDVVLVEDNIISNYDDASVGDVVAILCNLKNYVLNSNMQMTMYRYFWHETNEWVDKAILIVDGKLLDPDGVVIIKKGN